MEDSSVAEEIELPSKVTDRDEIFMPPDLKKDDPRIYGKWMWFTGGDLHRQDHVWIELQKLILSGEVLLLGSSTLKKCVNGGTSQGVIKCYTPTDIEIIKRAGLALQGILKENSILYFKTNEASASNLYRKFGSRFIVKYMLTLSGKLYERDELDRWEEVKDHVEEEASSEEKTAHYKKFNDEAKEENPMKKSESLPSQEYDKRRLFYPVSTTMSLSDHVWNLFCNIKDYDSSGMTELDRTWIEIKKMCDEGIFTRANTETYTFYPGFQGNKLRRTISCTVRHNYDLEELKESGDKLRERVLYNFPMYMKVCKNSKENRKILVNKYLYTEDRDLYESVNEGWRLIK